MEMFSFDVWVTGEIASFSFRLPVSRFLSSLLIGKGVTLPTGSCAVSVSGGGFVVVVVVAILS